MNQKSKALMINAFKLVCAAGILTWMIKSGKLNFKELAFFVEHPVAIAVPVTGWIFILLLLGAWRWQLLLHGIGLFTAYKRVVQLHWIGMFFNTTMPGAVGGDLIKAVYVIQDHKQYRTKAMLTILLDRIIGLMGLFTLGGITALFNLQEFLDNPALSSLVLFVLAVCLAIIIFFLLFFVKFRSDRDPFQKLFKLRFPGVGMLHKIYEALIIYKQKPWVLVYSWGLSVLLQAYVLGVLMFFTFMINGAMPPVSTLIPAIPVALLLTALPLAPAGMGVGHVAFAQVYQLAGVENGANVFNAYMISNIFMNLTGVVAYLLFKGKARELAPHEGLEVNP